MEIQEMIMTAYTNVADGLQRVDYHQADEGVKTEVKAYKVGDIIRIDIRQEDI